MRDTRGIREWRSSKYYKSFFLSPLLIMIDDQLKELVEYIEEIERKDPLEFLVEGTRKLLSVDYSDEGERGELQRELTAIIEKYDGVLTPSVIIREILTVYLNFLRRKTVEAKAISLGIKPTLYKKEMDFLFKGKSR